MGKEYVVVNVDTGDVVVRASTYEEAGRLFDEYERSYQPEEYDEESYFEIQEIETKSKDTSIRFRCTTDHKAMIETKAKESKLSVTDYLISLALKDDCSSWTQVMQCDSDEFEIFIRKKTKN